ncbi:ESPR-type extended signal peptide-containing protein [Dialister invisus]|uniref:ESPR-type extended signal peptide-containing protein n=1 Tax=Dialister invisus TaxID=218538 RepID=UPI0028EC5119|nr:ESPR-type extended signal peptide-containing protein [Dialister invisus]
MNRVYKIVWSKAKNAYVVTSELAKNHTKSASGKAVKAALTAAVGMGVLMGGYVADAAPATNPSGDGPGIAIGTGSSSPKVDSTAVGKNAKTTGERALAVGYNNMAGADGAMAVGNDNKAIAGGAVAVGAKNSAQGMGSLALGKYNVIKGDDSAAVGHSNKMHARGTYAFGLQNTVWEMYSQAYGMNNIVSEANSFAYGNSNQVGSMNSYAFGGGNLNTARWSVTVGNTNKVGGENSFAAGFYNTIGSTSKDAVAIGQNARVGVSNFNVATTIDPTTGKITAVYNGEVNATNSVAIGHEANVMALNSVALGENTGVTKDGKNGTAIGGEASVKAENGTAAGFKATVRAKSGVALGASSFVDAEGGVALGRNSVAERHSGVTGYDFTTGAVSTVNDSTWKATDGAVSVGSGANTRQITGVAAGTANTDAVNVAQIKGLAKKIVASTADYRLVKNASSADGFYTVDANGNIDLTVEDKNHAGQKETVKLKDIASKSKLDDVINKGLQFDANVGGVRTNKLGSKITVKGEGAGTAADYSGENLKTFITQDPAGNTTIDVKMNKNLKSETIVATGENGKDGKIGINGKDGQTTNISVTRDGKPGVDGAPGTTTTRIVYEKPDGTKEEVATLNDGMKYGGDTGNVIKKKLNEQVNVVGGITDTNKLTTEDNLGVVSDGGNDLKVRMAKDLKGLESVKTGDTVMNNNGVTINNGAAGNTVSLTKNGLNNGGNSITNVADGVNGTDAVNVNQLKKVKAAADAAKVHFFSVKGNSSDENYNNDGATGDRALAVGVAAKAGGLKATALTGGNASGDFSFAVGNNAQAKGWGSVAIGAGTLAEEQGTVAIGHGAKAYSLESVALGYNTQAGAPSGQPGAGNHAQTAMGSGTIATGGAATAFGFESVASGAHAIAGGDKAKATGQDSVALGKDTKASGTWSVALGSDTKAEGQSSTALGTDTTASGIASTAMGSKTQATGVGSTAMGGSTTAAGNWSLASGGLSEAKGDYSTAMGYNSKANARNSFAVSGGIVEAAAKNSIAMGEGAKASVSDAVALGSGSVASTEKGKVGYDISGTDHSNDTTGVWKSTANAVSVGDAFKGITRQITGVAAGTQDTDAVNVAQLKKAVAGAADGNDTLVSDSNALSLSGKTLSMSVKDTAGNEVKGSVDLSAIAGQIDTNTTYTMSGTQNADNTTTITLKGSDGKENKVTVATKDTRNTVKAGENVTLDTAANTFGGTEYTVNVKADGKVENGSTKIVSGNTVYHETRVKNDGNYVKKENSAGDNLTILDKQVGKNTTNITNLGNTINNLNGKLGTLDNRISKVGAGAAALAALHPLDFDPHDKWDIAAGFGNYRNASAAAVGLFYRPNERTMMSLGWTMGDDRNMINAGISVKLGRGDVYTRYSKVEMANRIEAQNKRINDMESELEELKAQIAALAVKK